MMCELFSKYDLLTLFKIPIPCLISFASALEVGYNKYQNPYHNAIHASDVTQTVHSILLHTGIMHWFTDLEILAIIFSTLIHDYEHTGTTNHFHVETRSETALLYNDRSVLENHHVSAAYHLLENEDMNILSNLTTDEWRELRRLVIEMVLATDMSHHFQQMSSIKHILERHQQLERAHKDKIMSMVVHAADVSHPAKPWTLHQRWAEALMEEFFQQGDKEAELGLPVSSLCDRKTTNIAASQIGFIDVIVKPIFVLLLDAVNEIVRPLIHEASKSRCASRRAQSMKTSKATDKEGASRESGTCTERQILSVLDIPRFKDNLLLIIQDNREKWKESQEVSRKEHSVSLLKLEAEAAETKGRSTQAKQEPLGTESNMIQNQVREGKAERKKPEKTVKSKPNPSKAKSSCIAPENPTTCYCQFGDSKTFEPIDVNFIVYNADASELLQAQEDTEAMDVTESYEEFVDSQSSWRKAAAHKVDSEIREMRRMVPETKPLSPDESDDVIIEEFIPDDSQPKTTKGSSAAPVQDKVQQPPNIGFLATDLTQSDMEIFSLWNEEVMRRAAEQQKQVQSRMPTEGAPEVPGLQVEGSTGSQRPSSENYDSFILQVISFDSPPVMCSRQAEPSQQEAANTQAPVNDNGTQSSESAQQTVTTTSLGAAAVSVTSLSYGYRLFKIPK
ncbi:uncharacterized protein LOC110083215 [Pogona vitticeps]